MLIRWRVAGLAFICLLAASGLLVADEIEQHQPDIDMFASMAGKCSALKVAQRDFVCTTVAFFHSPGGRSSFVVPLNDPDDDSHIIAFSGDRAKREQDVYELSIDRMLLKSKDRPKVDGLPVALEVLSTGTCRQIGKFTEQRVSSIACAASDADGTRYEFQFESDGSPIKVRMITVSDPATEERRAKALAAHIVQLKCRQMAEAQGVLTRDRTAFILQCMDEQ
jgi:hypothetical protein